MTTPEVRLVLTRTITLCIAVVWLLNGLYCKLLNLVPRHQLIVARILGDDYASVMTRLIGIMEVGMAVWVISRYRSRSNAVFQVLLIAAMNTIEFFKARDLLLFGSYNALVAIFFITVILLNEFVIQPSRPR